MLKRVGRCKPDPSFNVSTAGTYELLVVNTDNDCADSLEVMVSEDLAEPIALIENNPTLSCTENGG